MLVDPRSQTAKGATDALVELVDLYPTLAELCGLPLPNHLQGKSFLPVLQNPKQVHRKFAYSSYPHEGGSVVGHSIRNQRYRYTEWWDADTDEVLSRVLTDLIRDPGETTNVLEAPNLEIEEQWSRELRRIVSSARQLNE